MFSYKCDVRARIWTVVADVVSVAVNAIAGAVVGSPPGVSPGIGVSGNNVVSERGPVPTMLAVAFVPVEPQDTLAPRVARHREVSMSSFCPAGTDPVYRSREPVATAIYSADGLDNASQQLGHSEVGVTAKHYVQRLNIGPSGVVGVLDDWLQSAS
ncbi:hypothetical protein [Brevibacterium aurantiacum]|uniref:hypothetical protein n=1 Tax=Brevibacterium aurantiacum TaxID=273384 RepID=UPI000F6545C1|nr:hypothetical protein [Brevibacterium aurantiacum]AZL08582.1 hypothetical protein CXR26_04515 [Brevibacterium aurantiacum]